jgi:molybdenum cofactor cytidylyltransferase
VQVNDSNHARLRQSLAGLVLAAGPSSRLGQPKQLLMYRGQTLVERTVIQAAEFCGAGIVVVTGAESEQVAEALGGASVEIVNNPNWVEGMSSSVRIGLQHLDSKCRGVMLMLCDQPALNRDDLYSLASAWISKPELIAAAEYAGIRGVPAIFPMSYRKELMALEGDRGGRKIIADAEHVTVVKMPHAAFDIDTPNNLKDLYA